MTDESREDDEPREQPEGEQPEELTPAEEVAVEAVAEEIVAEAIAEEAVVEAIEAEVVAEVTGTEEAIEEAIVAEAVAEEAIIEAVEAEVVAEAAVEQALEEETEEPATPRVKPEIPGADLEPDIVGEGEDPLGRVKPEIPGADLEPDIVLEGEESYEADDEDAEEGEEAADDGEQHAEPIAAVTIDLAADARYRATGKRKTSVARVILKPGSGSYTINGRPLEDHFPRPTLQRQIRQPLEAVAYEARMDVVARIHGGGVSGQAGALRHGIARALLEAEPSLRGELKRRGFLTRDSRVKERKKAGLKKARKRPQFSKR